MPLGTRQWDSPPLGLNPQPCFDDIAARSVQPELGKLYAAELHARCLQPPPPPLQSLLYSHDKEYRGKRFSHSELRSWCAAATPPTPQREGALEPSSQKRLLIFDQSGNQTRLLRCPFPLRFPSAEPAKLSDLQHGLEKGFKEDHKEFDDENYLNGEESELHEDTEEINALLYSDDDYNDDDDYESDDEVMSTGHSPYPICNNKRQSKEEEEEIDGPRKKHKVSISDSSSLMGTKSSTNISTKEDNGSGLSNEQSRKDKIRTALKILESVVPGAAKGNEALLLLDEAIDYLKSLKQNLISHTEINKAVTTGQ